YGDVDGDGLSDVSVCGGGWSLSEGAIFSGRDGAVLHRYSARALAIVRDIDRDGCCEVLVARTVEPKEPIGPVGFSAGEPGKLKTIDVPVDFLRRSEFL